MQDYYQEVVLVDERRFLISEALDHLHKLPPNTVVGEKKVVIQDGEVLIDVPERVWILWREYETRDATKIKAEVHSQSSGTLDS
jgi:beta-galactosidase beta subunit